MEKTAGFRGIVQLLFQFIKLGIGLGVHCAASFISIGHDHITSAIGASYMSALGGSDIINAVTCVEHTGGIPTIQSIIEAIDTAATVVKIINDMSFLEYTKASTRTKKYSNCMGIPL